MMKNTRSNNKQFNLYPDSISILDVLIFEDEFKITANKYNTKKMKFLTKIIGGKNIITKILPSPYNKIFKFAYGINFKYPELTQIQTQLDGDWGVINVVNVLKKIQKLLEIYYLRYLHDESNHKDYMEIFNVKDVIDIKNEIIMNIIHKNEINNNAEKYNKEAIPARKYFVKQFKNYSINDLQDIDNIINIIKDYTASASISHPDLINKFKDAIFKLEEIKEDITLTEKKKKNKVKSIISTSFIKLNIRKVIDMDQYINDTLNYYISNMKKLNDIYGYERYITIVPTKEEINNVLN